MDVVEIAPVLRTELLRRWNEPHRRHHDQRHLDEVVAGLATLSEAGLDFDARPTVLAAWFHDAVYRPLRPDNEEASANLARELLVDDDDRDEVARLVELTRTHQPAPGDRNGIALSDADLAVLGADAHRYDEYAANVGEEFRRVPRPLYRRKRRELLAEFLTREHLYVSPPAQQLWEATARANIAREIEALAR
ncbi:HD domain-containing protein [Gordonia crocea]|uniref:Metal-dependent phosphohydrolase n=1 Tax=Gordonia crocea TaxID=589162 RepID=A0A7M3SUP6_9ACTN|nr:hypothetical protein [Gordonia crocea]GED96370.1 hypothetical protein nbrc107697_04090 [Gordonia crocea]